MRDTAVVSGVFPRNGGDLVKVLARDLAQLLPVPQPSVLGLRVTWKRDFFFKFVLKMREKKGGVGGYWSAFRKLRIFCSEVILLCRREIFLENLS